MNVLTAFPFPQYRRQFLAEGDDYFFDKANEFEQMVAVLQDLSVLGDGKPANMYTSVSGGTL